MYFKYCIVNKYIDFSLEWGEIKLHVGADYGEADDHKGISCHYLYTNFKKILKDWQIYPFWSHLVAVYQALFGKQNLSTYYMPNAVVSTRH